MKLFYNDYGAETMGPKSDRMYELVKGMLQRKVPIDGVGFQTHVSTSFSSQVSSMETNLKRFAALGLEIHITELDVRACDAKSKCDSVALQKQADTFAALLKMCLSIEKCKVFEMWGFTDRYTWITSFQNPTHKNEMPLPFDKHYAPKPAFKSMLSLLTGAAPPPAPPSPTPPPPPKRYTTQTGPCKNAVAISGKLSVASVAECEAKCDAEPECVAVDTNGRDCYTKRKCDGVVGACSGWCSYKVVEVV